MPARHFFDTNILLYAYDIEGGKKRETAAKLLEEALREPSQTSISVQVLQEFFVNFVRKNGDSHEAALLIDDLSRWTVIDNTHALFLDGLEIKARWKLSLWDAMVVAAAQKSESRILYTEDLNHGQQYGTVRAVNPFLHD